MRGPIRAVERTHGAPLGTEHLGLPRAISVGLGLGRCWRRTQRPLAASILSTLAISDSADEQAAPTGEIDYDVAVCAAAALAVILASALLYLPMPWGGICAAAVVATVAVALQLAGRRLPGTGRTDYHIRCSRA